jgi:hypothetical protein
MKKQEEQCVPQELQEVPKEEAERAKEEEERMRQEQEQRVRLEQELRVRLEQEVRVRLEQELRVRLEQEHAHTKEVHVHQEQKQEQEHAKELARAKEELPKPRLTVGRFEFFEEPKSVLLCRTPVSLYSMVKECASQGTLLLRDGDSVLVDGTQYLVLFAGVVYEVFSKNSCMIASEDGTYFRLVLLEEMVESSTRPVSVFEGLLPLQQQALKLNSGSKKGKVPVTVGELRAGFSTKKKPTPSAAPTGTVPVSPTETTGRLSSLQQPMFADRVQEASMTALRTALGSAEQHADIIRSTLGSVESLLGSSKRKTTTITEQLAAIARNTSSNTVSDAVATAVTEAVAAAVKEAVAPLEATLTALSDKVDDVKKQLKAVERKVGALQLNLDAERKVQSIRDDEDDAAPALPTHRVDRKPSAPSSSSSKSTRKRQADAEEEASSLEAKTVLKARQRTSSKNNSKQLKRDDDLDSPDQPLRGKTWVCVACGGTNAKARNTCYHCEL